MRLFMFIKQGNLYAPSGERDTGNERSPGALGIPTLMPLVGGGTFVGKLPASMMKTDHILRGNPKKYVPAPFQLILAFVELIDIECNAVY